MPTERQLNIILESELEFKTFNQEPMSNKLEYLGKMMPDINTLPADVELHISNKSDDITAKFKDVNDYDAGYNLGFDRGYTQAATEAAHLLYEVFQKHESGLLPDRFIYNKIKMFLYGK